MRLAALASTSLLDTPPEPEFDTIVRLAQRTLRCKIALISLLDGDRQWFKAKCGLSVDETPIEHSFCAHAVGADDILVVPDARADPRFADNPLVVGPPFIRFYAGMPIHHRDRDRAPTAIGTLCVIHDEPRRLSADEAASLLDLARMTEACIRAREIARAATTLAEDRQCDLRRMDREQRQFRQAERMADIGSWRLSLADQTVEWSTQVFAIHDLPGGQPPPLAAAMDFYPPQAKPVISAAVQGTIATGRPFDVETDFVTATGRTKRVRSMGEIETVDGRPVALIGVFQDITAQHRMAQALRRGATTDELTQVANRAGCDAAIAQRFAGARDRGGAGALMLIDLDGFKAINDLHGHQCGDEVLRRVGALLRASYLSDCFVGRLGGDEFVVVTAADVDALAAETLVRNLLADLRHRVDVEGKALHVSGTIGMSWLDATVESASDWLRRADIALYDAKRERRGTARVYGRPSDIGAGETSTRGARHRVSG